MLNLRVEMPTTASLDKELTALDKWKLSTSMGLLKEFDGIYQKHLSEPITYRQVGMIQAEVDDFIREFGVVGDVDEVIQEEMGLLDKRFKETSGSTCVVS